MTRRRWLAAVTTGLAAFATSRVGLATEVLQTADPRKWADPPGPESADVARRIGAVGERLEAGTAVSDVLSQGAVSDLRPYPRFRELIRRHATSSPLTVCSMQEPGERAVLRLRVVTANQQPVRDALVYVYHTSASGWYAANAYHVRAQSGDERHARLFGYVRSNQNGFVEIQTIRPAGYPDGDLPAHYHVEVLAPGSAVTEVQFSDDPRLTADARARSLREGFVIADPRKGTEGWWRISADIVAR